MNDFRTLHHHISEYSTVPPMDASSSSHPAYTILRQCNVQGQSLLSASFPVQATGLYDAPSSPSATSSTSATSISELESQKAQLQRIILDASAKRLVAQRLYLKCAAAVRWIRRCEVVKREEVLGSQRWRDRTRAADGFLRDVCHTL